TATSETAEAQINAIDDMREASVRINDLRHERIEKIERDVRAFEADVAALARAIAPGLDGANPEEAVLEFDRLAAEAARTRDLKAAKDSDIGGLQQRIDNAVNRVVKPVKSSRGYSGRPQSSRSTTSGSRFSAPTRCAC